MDTTNIFPFLSIFALIFLLSPPKKKSNFWPIQLDIIAYIVSKAMNYDCAKFHKRMFDILTDKRKDTE